MGPIGRSVSNTYNEMIQNHFYIYIKLCNWTYCHLLQILEACRSDVLCNWTLLATGSASTAYDEVIRNHLDKYNKYKLLLTNRPPIIDPQLPDVLNVSCHAEELAPISRTMSVNIHKCIIRCTLRKLKNIMQC